MTSVPHSPTVEPSLFDATERAFIAYRDGDPLHMAVLVRLLTPILWNLVRGLGASHHVAEDILQTVWAQLVDHAHTIDDPRAVVKWVTLTARRETWRVLKRDARCNPVERDDLVALTETEPVDSPEEQVVTIESHRELWRHVQGLPARCQSLLRAVAVTHRPDYDELAAALGIPRGSVGPTRSRCLAKLRTSLAAGRAA